MQDLNSEHAFFNGLPSHEITNFDITCINTVVKGQSSSGWTLDRRISTGREFFCLGFVLSGEGINLKITLIAMWKNVTFCS